MKNNNPSPFDTASFSAGAFGSALLIAGSLVAGVANATRRNADAWAGWTRGQLEQAVRISEALNAVLRRQLDEERAENRRLREVIRRGAGRVR